MVAIMVVGIIFAAHGYYKALGGQGFLKAKRKAASPGQNKGTLVYLPLRKVEAPVKGQTDWSLVGRQKNVPYYICGDQRNSCGSFNQHDICCPITMACYPAKFTPSGIFCCNDTKTSFDCEPSEDDPPKCIEGTVQCSEATGGGCCPSTKECSPNGCVHVLNASIISASPSTVESSSSVTKASSIVGTPIVFITVTEVPEATQTLAKVGEVMQARGSGDSIVMKLCVPYSTVYLLVGVAVLMGVL
ncbi:hypothetical protein LZ554_000531 [Drepanopeziza brunnea f. sp. 'monogermtubi']|nr:hypothetical protein LZ554_000531 [Drepanopeziza brunnea f. sp. 'monogermtubi']